MIHTAVNHYNYSHIFCLKFKPNSNKLNKSRLKYKYKPSLKNAKIKHYVEIMSAYKQLYIELFD